MQQVNIDTVDMYWQRLASAMVGEQFEAQYTEDVCGAVIHKRKTPNSKFSVWTSTWQDDASVRSIG